MNKFFEISKEDIKLAEDKMGLSFPSELKRFYLTHGYGFLDSKNDNFNRIMDPMSVAHFRLHEYEYEGMESMDVYDSTSDNRLVFFEVSEGLFLSIELTTKYKQKIYLMDKVVADSLGEFLKVYPENESIIFAYLDD